MNKFARQLYYYAKPLIPIRLRLYLRRKYIARKEGLYSDVWPIDRGAGNPLKDWKGWPDGKMFALVLTHDVETEKGQSRCYALAQLEIGLGFRSSFNFVPKDYRVDADLQHYLIENGFEVGLHGLSHNGNIFRSRKVFLNQVPKINEYLKKLGAVGFRAPSMYHNLEWIHELNIEYDSSTFDTDPFEPQPDGAKAVFPFWVNHGSIDKGYVELPYTLPQDHTLFVLMNKRNIDIWKQKLDWIVERGGMALMITHPDYMNFDGKKAINEYPFEYYEEFLEHIKTRYKGQYWHLLAKNMAVFWKEFLRRSQK